MPIAQPIPDTIVARTLVAALLATVALVAVAAWVLDRPASHEPIRGEAPAIEPAEPPRARAQDASTAPLRSSGDDESSAPPTPADDIPLDYISENLQQLAARAASGERRAGLLLARLALHCYITPTPECEAYARSVTPRDTLAWVDVAAASGSILAQEYYLDVALGAAEPGDEDYASKRREFAAKAAQYLESAAHRGSANAMIKLGQLYRSGQFVARDPERAYLYGLAGALAVPSRHGYTVEQVESELPWLGELGAELEASRLSSIRGTAREMSQCCP